MSNIACEEDARLVQADDITFYMSICEHFGVNTDLGKIGCDFDEVQFKQMKNVLNISAIGYRKTDMLPYMFVVSLDIDCKQRKLIGFNSCNHVLAFLFFAATFKIKDHYNGNDNTNKPL